MTHGRGKSDSAVVAGKSVNKAEQLAAEPMERRAGAKGNADQQTTRRARNRESVSQALERIRQAARHRKKERFTSLLQHVGADLLRLAFFELKRNAAAGVDGLTWQDYEADLEPRLMDLHLLRAAVPLNLSRVQNFTALNPSGSPAVVIAKLECIKIPQAVYILGLPARSRLLLVMRFVIPISSGRSR